MTGTIRQQCRTPRKACNTGTILAKPGRMAGKPMNKALEIKVAKCFQIDKLPR